MQHLQPNTTLQGGKYRIERVLGQGGFGITYLAWNTLFDVNIAIKEFFMKDENGRDGNSVTMPNTTKSELFNGQKEKFKKEAKRMFAIKNEHIVGVQDLFEENGTAYYVMDYIDGESLAAKMKRTGSPMTESEVNKILPQILDALKVIHENGIWHLDLKPANIMIDKAGNVKLIDFGASKQLNAQKGGATTSTAISYTNGYAPREQMEQNYDKFGPWTDIYALGATLYTLLTNKRPPLPTDIDDDISEDKHLALPFPNSVSEEMKGYILWLMQTNRNKRPQSIDELVSEKKESVNPLSVSGIKPKIENSNFSEETIIVNSKDEETILESKVVSKDQSYSYQPNNSQKNDDYHIIPDEKDGIIPETGWKNKKAIYWILGILAAVFIFYQFYGNHYQNIPANAIEEETDSVMPVVEIEPTAETIQESPSDIYKDRIEKFVINQSGVIVSYPNDSRYCVYFSKPLNGHKELYRYDALTDNTEKMDLPIEATWGYTDLWLSKNQRYLFVAAEERYTDFIRIDTETKQVLYITDCHHVKRSKNGFVVTKAECINEMTAESMADREYEYIDYYYTDEGIYTGNHSNPYK